MRYRITHLAGSVLLSAVMTGSALGQNLGSASTVTNQLQGLQHSAIKMAEIGAGVGLGMTVIGLALHARHHRSKQPASNVDYKALSEEYARQLRDMQARSLMPAAGVAAAGPARTAAQGAETAVPAVFIPAQAANVAPPATAETPRP